MQITDFHATYYSYLLTQRSAENSTDMLVATLQDSKVDLNPHQIEAALFVLSLPFSCGIDFSYLERESNMWSLG